MIGRTSCSRWIRKGQIFARVPGRDSTPVHDAATRRGGRSNRQASRQAGRQAGSGQQQARTSNARVCAARRGAHVRVAVRDRPGPLTYITRGVQVPHIRVSTHKRYSAAPSRSGPRRDRVRSPLVSSLVSARSPAPARCRSSTGCRGKRQETRTVRLRACVRTEIERESVGG